LGALVLRQRDAISLRGHRALLLLVPKTCEETIVSYPSW
jgi:hypothetical protein